MCISLWFCLVSIRSSWRVRRKSHAKRDRSDATTGSGHDTEKSPAHEVHHPGDRPYQANLYTILERSRSQRGRVREPPVIIGDPTDKNILAQENRRRTSSRTSARIIEDPTPRSSRHSSTRRSTNGPEDILSRNPLDLRIIPMIPQEDSEDVSLTMSHRDLRSRSPSYSLPRSHQHTPTHTPSHAIFQP